MQREKMHVIGGIVWESDRSPGSNRIFRFNGSMRKLRRFFPLEHSWLIAKIETNLVTKSFNVSRKLKMCMKNCKARAYTLHQAPIITQGGLSFPLWKLGWSKSFRIKLFSFFVSVVVLRTMNTPWLFLKA